MIYYDTWLSRDAALMAVQLRNNDASAARIYASLKPLRAVLQEIGALIGSVWRSALGRLRRKAAVRELQGLDDRLLQDIGLTRGQIDELARSSFGRDMEHRIVLRGGRPLIGLAATKKQPVCDVIPLEPLRQARDAQELNEKPSRRTRSRDAA